MHAMRSSVAEPLYSNQYGKKKEKKKSSKMWSDEEDWPLFMGIFASVTAGTKGFRKNVILSDGLSLLRDKSAGLLIKRL